MDVKCRTKLARFNLATILCQMTDEVSTKGRTVIIVGKGYYKKLIINDQIQSFADFAAPSVEPLLVMLGAKYPNTQTNPFNGVLEIFDNYFWSLLVLTVYYTNPYVVLVGSLLVAKSNPRLQTKLYMPNVTLQDILENAHPDERWALNKALANGWDNNYIDMSYTEFYGKIETFIDDMCNKRKVRIFNECGLFERMADTGLRMAYNLFVPEKVYLVLKQDDDFMVLDEMRIVFGPLTMQLLNSFAALRMRYLKELDFNIDKLHINDQMLTFSDFAAPTVEPLLTMLGAKYPNTQTNPFNVLDTIANNDVDTHLSRPQLQPKLYMSNTTLQEILKKSHPDENFVLNKALANGWDSNYIDWSNTDFYGDINTIIANICYKRLHVLLGGYHKITTILQMNRVYYEQVTHIGKTTYYDHAYGYVFNKNVNPVIKQI
ncbi:unnamed protein product [Medioppia subpectinata]|uniref:Uncharacterized protein n=1 Tax=Medioppia subpectinata TaxID=1979941 RepID=A0A7R9KLU3_9ACAR|nr:unnamed protein product [Medioppia subpectinata]CAG2104631.1 unnamed protein product [Medioppia subpectinata]